MDRMEKVDLLRQDIDVHHNCCQTVLMAFADECGLSDERCMELGSYFGSGMSMGATCGVITGGLMAIGLMGGSPEDAASFKNTLRQRHGAVNCADLLRISAEKEGIDFSKKAHCDGLIREAVQLIDEIMKK